ncbi:hypothetical protein NE237_010143 [Protea cynaroides]|uniref:Uncharacterized protein n=1 Tax=Protea cynaroides TaxID=273540 RepID=A0A9Q0R0Z0_9MAGN|nr:hypothetical protein NE237_010143 [Protea cynaroides]
MFFEGEKRHPYAVGRNHVLLHLVDVAVDGDQNGDEGAAYWSEGPRKGDEGSIVRSSEVSSADLSAALIIVSSFRSVAESALVRVVVAGGYGNGGYGVAQADTMAAKVNQCDEICGNFCDNSRIYISNLLPDVTTDKLREFFGDWKLTPTEHREKKKRKLVEDSNTLKTLVLMYWINDMSHSHTHFKDDVVSDGISVVIVEVVVSPSRDMGKLHRVFSILVETEPSWQTLSKMMVGEASKPAIGLLFGSGCRTEQ